MRRDAGTFQDQGDAADNPFLRGGGCGQHFSRKEALAGLEDDIRKGPPNIDGEPATFHYQRSEFPKDLPDTNKPVTRTAHLVFAEGLRERPVPALVIREVVAASWRLSAVR